MATEEEVYIDLRKMKMPELRKELLDRGLKTSGNKQELIDRLQQYMEEHEGAEVADDDILKEDCEGDDHLADDNKIEDVLTSDKEPEKKEESEPVEEKSKIEENSITDLQSTNSITDEEKLKIRAKKFGMSVSDMNPETRKAARSQRFGIGSVGGGAPTANMDVLKKRAERFGTVTSGALNQSEGDEKRRKRLARFGDSTASSVSGDVDKKKKRAERFGLVA